MPSTARGHGKRETMMYRPEQFNLCRHLRLAHCPALPLRLPGRMLLAHPLRPLFILRPPDTSGRGAGPRRGRTGQGPLQKPHRAPMRVCPSCFPSAVLAHLRHAPQVTARSRDTGPPPPGCTRFVPRAFNGQGCAPLCACGPLPGRLRFLPNHRAGVAFGATVGAAGACPTPKNGARPWSAVARECFSSWS